MRQLVNPKTFGTPSIALARFGCANRPFYQIAVLPDKALGRRSEGTIIEQVGTFDPLPNARNEKLVSLNIHRIKYWIGERNANVTVSVLELLGLAGLLPLHPKTFIRAKQNRKLLDEGLKRFKSSSKSQEDGSGAEEAPEQESVASGH